MAISKYKSETFLNEDGSVIGTAGNFKIAIDHKAMHDLDHELSGMSPVEAWINSLAACHLMTIKLLAKAKRIALKNAKIVIAAEADTEPSDDYYGIKKLEIHYYIQAENTNDEISDFIKYTQERCALHATIETLTKTELKYVIHIVK